MTEASIQHHAEALGVACDYYDVDGNYQRITDEVLSYFCQLFSEAVPPLANEVVFDAVKIIPADKKVSLSLKELGIHIKKVCDYSLTNEQSELIS